MQGSDVVIPIPPTDPLAALLVSRAEPVDLVDLELKSEALDRLRAAGIVLVVPLVSEGRLLGTVNLGPRKSEQDYTTDDRSLLSTLASQLAPAVRLASLARQQEEEAAERERIEQELRVARVIQQTLLPHDLPEIPGWEVAAHYRPAREVGGDFYDILTTADGRMVLIEGDVTDKGVPAALVMATCRAALRAAVDLTSDPGEILSRANNALVHDIPPTMFVTCFCGVVDPGTGRIRFANAGHPVPVVAHGSGSSELRAAGMPLGLMPDAPYDVVEAVLAPGSVMVVASDGVAEAHGADGTMFGFNRVEDVVATCEADPIDALLSQVDAFAVYQEDDITLVALRRLASAEEAAEVFGGAEFSFDVPSVEGAERDAMERVVASARDAGMDEARAAKLGTAVAEAVMNAAEHGNGFDPEQMVGVVFHDRGRAIVVEVSDSGGGVKESDLVEPDLEAKLEGEQGARGWGRFLIERLVDELHDRTEDGRHVLELRMMKVGP